MGTFGLNDKGKVFFSELPLHKGRCNRVDSSSGVYLLTRAECDAMRRFLHSYRVSPYY